MTREEFKQFVERTLEEVVQLAEKQTGKILSRKIAFHWFARESDPIITKDIAEYITQRIYIDENHIYPIVDIGVADVLDDGTVLIEAIIAGYSPQHFQKNWTGRDGPFVHMVSQNVIDKLSRS